MDENLNFAGSGPWGSEPKVRIYMEVDAKTLFNKPQLDLNDIHMWDSQGNSGTGEALKNFTTDVFSNKKVIWEAEVDGESEAQNYSVKIEQIEIEGAPCLFKRVRLPGKKGKVQATVGDAAEKCESTYAIWFSIYNPDQESVVFRLDPKLRGNTIATSFSAYLQNFINNFPIDIKLKEELIKVIENFEK